MLSSLHQDLNLDFLEEVPCKTLAIFQLDLQGAWLVNIADPVLARAQLCGKCRVSFGNSYFESHGKMVIS